MVFSANNQQNDLTFDFNSTLIQTVNTHKHIGVIFSCDCKSTSPQLSHTSDPYYNIGLINVI
jgi:hypothetical protein